MSYSKVKFSIIIPALNEEHLIEKNLLLISHILNQVQDISHHPFEIIIADGGSRDRTVEIAGRFADEVCISTAGRGIQMNTGARISTGDWLLFLHVDSVISESGIRRMLKVINSNPESIHEIGGGAFSLKIDSDKILLKIISSVTNIRSKVFNIAYGDQGLFVKRDIFLKIGGYSDIPVMEDIEFVVRLKKNSRFVILPEYVTTSSRRWDNEGIFYTTIRNWVFILLYMAGVSPHKLKRWYRAHGG